MKRANSKQMSGVKGPAPIVGMVKIKSESDRYVELKEKDYLLLLENTIMLEALKIAGIESMPIYKAMRKIIDDKRVEIHLKPVNHRYS